METDSAVARATHRLRRAISWSETMPIEVAAIGAFVIDALRGRRRRLEATWPPRLKARARAQAERS
jgi:hypothetical protein